MSRPSSSSRTKYVSGSWTTITILAWADFDGDGEDDIFVDVGSLAVTWREDDHDPIISTGVSGSRFVLTRNAEDRVLRVVDAERYLSLMHADEPPCIAP